MENNEIVDVRVVDSVSNYTETVKNAAIAGVVTVLATAITTYALQNLADRAKKRQNKNRSTSLS